MGYRQGVRQRTLTPSFRWFESSYPNHVGMDFTPFKKPGLGRAFLIRSVIPPSPQKSRLFRGPRPFGALQSSLFRPSPNSVFAVRRNFGPAFGRKELGEKRLLCGRFASFSPKMLEILGVVSLEHKNGLTPFKKFVFGSVRLFA